MSSPRVRAQEDQVASRIRTMFGSWLVLVNDAVLGVARRLGLLPDPVAVYMVSNRWNTLVQEMLIPDLRAAAAIGWSEAFQRPVFSSTSAHVANALATSENLLSNIPAEVHQLVTEEIGDGLSLGESRQEIVSRIDVVLSMTGSERWTNRASVIAITETTRASNAGALAAAVQAERELGTIQKTWRSEGDHRVRETHRLVDGTEQPLMQPFMVGGFPLMYPSEPYGPPEETIGCRCAMSFKVVGR